MKIKQKIVACGAALVTLGSSANACAEDSCEVYVDHASNSVTIFSLTSVEMVAPNASIEHRVARTIQCDEGTSREGMGFSQTPKTEEEREELRDQCKSHGLKFNF